MQCSCGPVHRYCTRGAPRSQGTVQAKAKSFAQVQKWSSKTQIINPPHYLPPTGSPLKVSASGLVGRFSLEALTHRALTLRALTHRLPLEVLSLRCPLLLAGPSRHRLLCHVLEQLAEHEVLPLQGVHPLLQITVPVFHILRLDLDVRDIGLLPLPGLLC